MPTQPIISILWVAFVAVWVVSALRYHHQGSPKARAKGAWVRLLAAILFLVLLTGVYQGRLIPASTHPAFAWVGVALTAIGIAFAFWARASLGGSWGMPTAQASRPTLVTSGPYHWVRHPIYTGVLLATTGTAIAISPLLFLPFAVLLVYFVTAAVQEERFLAAEIGGTYEAYRERTKMFVPGIF